MIAAATPVASPAPLPRGAAWPAPRSRFSAWDAVVLSAVVAVAYALKRHYSTASAEELRWALAPTTALVESITGLRFAAERGAGYMSESHRLVIAPACAGVNFLIIALLSLSFGFVTWVRSPARKAAFAAGCLLSAYAAMVIVNAARISIGIVLGAHLGPLGGATFEQVHRVEGVVTYLLALSALMTAARATVSRSAA